MFLLRKAVSLIYICLLSIFLYSPQPKPLNFFRKKQKGHRASLTQTDNQNVQKLLRGFYCTVSYRNESMMKFSFYKTIDISHWVCFAYANDFRHFPIKEEEEPSCSRNPQGDTTSLLAHDATMRLNSRKNAQLSTSAISY